DSWLEAAWAGVEEYRPAAASTPPHACRSRNSAAPRFSARNRENGSREVPDRDRARQQGVPLLEQELHAPEINERRSRLRCNIVRPRSSDVRSSNSGQRPGSKTW